MKISEAILLGSVGTKQGEGNMAMYTDSPGMCALGTALFAVGKACASTDKPIDHPYSVVKDEWPWIAKTMAIHPVTGDERRVIECIYSLNDRGWTRPQIAEWVKQFEPADDHVPVPEQETETATTTK